MTPQEIQLYLPILIVAAMFALRWRQMIRPRKLRLVTLWMGPVAVLAGIALTMAGRPAPTVGHDLGLAVLAVAGSALGWTRAKLSKVEFDSENAMLTLRGTPYGILFLLALIAIRTGLRILSAKHPEWGINLTRATDFLLFFAFGLVLGYAAEVYRAARQVKRRTA
ncbi:MAG TPA: hypothetical protein VL899_09075 [Alphaproteobacteria bacterium]|nr:hypothetical protein [Alphaproteobacteria bacterium]